jgi:pimeloyl-ACP methyl ester carboxylesterase
MLRAAMPRPPTALLCAFALALLACRPAAPDAAARLSECRVPGVERAVLCGSVVVPEDPARPDGKTLEIAYVVVPAVARRKEPDPVFVLAGGPGQAGRRIAGTVLPLLAELNTRRDIVFIDQRGTGQSGALTCADEDSLAATLDPAQQLAHLKTCLSGLGERTRHMATWIAVRDFDAVRRALGAERVNLWGASYGTRAALEYLRQYPNHVRTVVLDGVAPPDMVLPVAFARDADAALDALVASCRADARCVARFPDVAERIAALLARADAGFDVSVRHPVSGAPQTLHVDRRLLSSLLRVPLYVPSLAAVLPQALAAAGGGDFDALVAMTAAVSGRLQQDVALGMHFAVVCAEDVPRIDAAALGAAAATRFGTTFPDLYRDACSAVAAGAVPPEFYTVPRSEVPVLILSGGRDPATPPRHGEAVAGRLGNARHVIAPALGHGVSGQGCAPRLIARFVRRAEHATLDTACLERLPAPPFFEPPAAR